VCGLLAFLGGFDGEEGDTGRARSGYASMASAQYRHFVNGFGIRWLLAALVSTLKAFFRSSKARQGGMT